MRSNMWRRLVNWLNPAAKQIPPRRHDQKVRRLVVEVLEDRLAPALTSPTWVEQGPGLNSNGQTEGLMNNPTSGAVEAIAAHPTNANIAVIGTVNGGIWTTANATAPVPIWSPRTDDLPSLSIGALAYSPTDPDVLYAGTGSFSSSGGAGGAGIGVLKSVDGGASWTEVGGTTLDNQLIRTVRPTTLGGGDVVFVGSVNSGVYQSTNAGATFTQLSGTGGLPAGGCFTIVADGADADTFYASIGINSEDQGVYRTDDAGDTWTDVSDGITGLGGAAVRIELAAHYDANDTSKALYCAVIAQANGELSGMFRSGDGGGTWVKMDAVKTNEGPLSIGLHPSNKPIGSGVPDSPGGQGSTHFSMLADRTNEFIIYVGGDRQPANPGPDGIAGNADDTLPNSIGAANSSGRHFRGDASELAGTQWYAINAKGLASNPNDGANGTSPHADSREMVFDANGNIIEADDGGIYRLSNPNMAARKWSSVNGNLRVTEFYSLAYDSLNNVVLGGTQDVGTLRQNSTDEFPWTTIQGGDGGVVNVDVTSSPGNAIVYTSSQNLGGFTRRTYTSTGLQTGAAAVGLIVNGSGGKTLAKYDTTIQFIQPWVLNAVDPKRMLIGTTDLYESLNRGDALTDLNYGGSGAIGALAFGGKLAGVKNANVIYVSAGATLRLRTMAGGAFTVLAAYAGSSIRDITLDPDNWQRAYVLDSAGRVWRTTDAGVTFTNITNNLLSLLPTASTDLLTIEIYSRNATADLTDAIFVGGIGGVYATGDPEAGAAATWIEFGADLPNYLVRDLRYDAKDDVLLAGGFGRGAWMVSELSSFVDDVTTVTLDGTNNLVVTDLSAAGKDDTLTLSRSGANVRFYDPNNVLAAEVGATQVDDNTVDVPLAAITGPKGIVVNTLGGNDSLTLDDAAGNPIPAAGLIFNGGAGADSLVANDADNIWNLTAANTGSISTLFVSFASVENLTAGDGRDVFRLTTLGSSSGKINGGDGSNWLDYADATSSVVVNLATGAATRVTGGVLGFDNVIGSKNGNDKLIGNANGGVLVGHGKGNTITAGAGRSVLIGGYGINRIGGGGADDLLINGRTAHDRNYITLEAILAIWQNADTYANRIAALQAVGPNQLKIGATIFVHPGTYAGGVGPRLGNGNFVYQSTLTGNAGSDWFISKFLGAALDRKPGEVVTTS
ncbi:MAG: hypothetical protein EXR98_21155 [Gemmataceae bacterium]|nr:hypothetical protein [Gemmataceae bacterium]